MGDPIFDEPRLADIYDLLDPDRSDLEAYGALVDELGASTVLDLGCGTGTFACLLALAGKDVTAVDPAAASLDVARRKPGASDVTWLCGQATDAPVMQVDLVTMTGNVAQVFLTDDEWLATLSAAHGALRPGGFLVFETRDPARQAWRGWTREQSHRRVDLAELGTVETWVDLTQVDLPLVSFRWTFVFHADGTVLSSDSTLRFRDRDELTTSLAAAGVEVRDIRDAPDRPGAELVYIATPAS